VEKLRCKRFEEFPLSINAEELELTASLFTAADKFLNAVAAAPEDDETVAVSDDPHPARVEMHKSERKAVFVDLNMNVPLLIKF